MHHAGRLGIARAPSASACRQCVAFDPRTPFCCGSAYRVGPRRKRIFAHHTLRVFVSVCVSALLYTALSHAPIVFMSRAEINVGQIDMCIPIAPSSRPDSL